MGKIAVCILFLVAPLVAQHFVTSAPPAAATSPVCEASAGCIYLALDTPSRQRVGLRGVDANGFVDFNSRWGKMGIRAMPALGMCSARGIEAMCCAF